MIVLSILFQNIGKFLCLRLFKTKLADIRKQWHWKRYVYEFSGTVFLLLISFIVFTSLNIYYGKPYPTNDSLTYGMEVSETAEQIGFENGDKLITVNGEEVKFFDTRKLLFDLLLEDNAYVDVDRNGTAIRLIISDEQKKIILDNRDDFIKARFIEKLNLTYEKYGIAELLSKFYRNVNGAAESVRILTIGPSMVQGYKKVKGPVALRVTNFLSFLASFQMNCLMLMIINLIPLPGLDSGNIIIALLERRREKVFPAKKLFIIRLAGIGTLVAWILIDIFLL